MHQPQAPTSELLTAQDVGRLLDVDASTVYRMAGDGRLPAVKIGRQWRFPAGALRDAVQAGVPLTGVAPALRGAPSPQAAPAEATLWAETPYARDLVDVAAVALGVMMVITDLQGRALTPVANPCRWYADRADDPVVTTACSQEWSDLAVDLEFEPRFRRGAFGFECARSLVRSGPHLVGMVLAGGVAPAEAEAALRHDLHHLTPTGRDRALTTLPRVAAALSRLAGHPTPGASPLAADEGSDG